MVFGSFGKTVFISKEEYDKTFPPKEIDSKLKESMIFLKENKRQYQDWLHTNMNDEVHK